VLAVLAQGNPAVLRPAELSALTGIPKGHVAHVRARLQASGIIRHSKGHRYKVLPPPWWQITNSQNKNSPPMAVPANSPETITDSPTSPNPAGTAQIQIRQIWRKNSPKMAKMPQNAPPTSTNLPIGSCCSGPQKNSLKGRKNSPKMAKILNSVNSTLSDSFSPNLANFPRFMSTKGAGYIRNSNNMMMMMIDNKEEGCAQKRAKVVQNSTELVQLGFLDAEEFVARYGWERVAKAMEFVNQWNPRNPGAALRFVLERGGPPRARQRWEKYFRGRYGSQLRLLEEGRDGGGFSDR